MRPITLASLAFDEVKLVSFSSNGANNVILDVFSVDEDDTNFINITNIADGDLTISAEPACMLNHLSSLLAPAMMRQVWGKEEGTQQQRVCVLSTR